MYKIKDKFLGSEIRSNTRRGLNVDLSWKTSQKTLEHLFYIDHPAVYKMEEPKKPTEKEIWKKEEPEDIFNIKELEPKVEVKPKRKQRKSKTLKQEVQVKSVEDNKSNS